MERLRKQYDVAGTKVSGSTLLIITLILTGLIIFGVFLGSPYFQQMFDPRTTPPPEGVGEGYAIIYLADGYTDDENPELIAAGTIDLYIFDWFDHDNYTTVKNGVPFYVSNATFGYLINETYNAIGFVVETNPDPAKPQTNTFIIWERCDSDDVEVRIVGINGIWRTWDSAFNTTDLSTGMHDIWFETRVHLPSAGSSRFTTTLLHGSYVPEAIASELATNLTHRWGNWIGFNGTVETTEPDRNLFEVNDFSMIEFYALPNIYPHEFSNGTLRNQLLLTVNITSSIDSIIFYNGFICYHDSPFATIL